MNTLVRDSYQHSNGLSRAHLQHPATASSQTSLQKISDSAAQYLFANNNNQPSQMTQQQTQHMQFPPPPPVSQTVGQQQSMPHMPKAETISMNSYNSMIVPQMQQQQQPNQPQHLLQSINLDHTTMVAPSQSQLNGIPGINNQSQSQMLMSASVANKTNQPHQQISYAPQQHPSYQNQHSQATMVDNSQVMQHQQVPMTTIMIPATAATALQSAAAQIQQATSHAMLNNPGQGQILVLMIPYMMNPQPTIIPPTPEQAASINSSSLLRQSNSGSFIRSSQHNLGPSSSRAISSLSSNKQDSETFYIKVNFSYQAERHKRELNFQKGEILHVLDTLQNTDHNRQYWLATRVLSNGRDAEKGFIPDKHRAEELAREQRAFELGEAGGTIDASTGSILSASVGRVSFLKRKSAQRSKSLCKDNWDNVVFDIGSFKLPVYERVVFRHPGFCRPVVIFGSLADVAREKLLKDYPERYAYPSGFNQSMDHPKVIRLQGILEIIDQGKHALLDITPSAVEKLNYVNMAPIVIFMKTESKSVIKEFRSRAAKSLDASERNDDTLRRDGKSSRKLLEQSIKLEKMWHHVFTTTLDLSTMGSEMWYRKLRETIESQQSANIWMSERKSDKRNQPSIANNDAALSTAQSSASRLESATGNLEEQFNENLSLNSKSTLDLAPNGIYGNRSQLRNAYAHSLAQKLARASSEPKLNGQVSDHDEDDDHDDDEDDDDEIIKKPFPIEFENSSSISSSNGELKSMNFGQNSMASSNLVYQQQFPPPAKPETSMHRAQESIYASRNQMVNNSYGNGCSTSNTIYHPFPQMHNDNGCHNQTLPNMNSNNGTNNNNLIDLSRNHDTRGSAYQVYSDMNQNNYHYYSLNKI